jgi:periplasmic copper chaperone A
LTNNSNILLLAFFMSLNGLVQSADTGRAAHLSGLKLSATRERTAAHAPQQLDANQIIIRDGWVQAGPPAQKITAAYMVIENHTDTEVALLSANTEVARVVELHKMELADGMMRMHKVDAIKIPAGGQTELKPGGYHLMVIGVKQELKEGTDVTLTLQFSNEIKKTITVPVKPRSAMVKEGEANG